MGDCGMQNNPWMVEFSGVSGLAENGISAMH
jgi:hypothetical protein